jgi:hypothetical protein
VAKPAPKSGLVIRYDYLWIEEEKEGREEGGKARPCAVVVAIPAADAAPLRALVCALTHVPPAKAGEKIAIPPKVKAHLGLDDDQSWIAVGEVNIVDWDDPGIVPARPGQWAYGFLPPAFARRVVEEVRAKSARRALGFVDRPAIEKKWREKGA